jgi:hypothetical protein
LASLRAILSEIAGSSESLSLVFLLLGFGRFVYAGLMQREACLKMLYVEIPSWIVAGLDREAARLGRTRKAVVLAAVASHLDRPPLSVVDLDSEENEGLLGCTFRSISLAFLSRVDARAAENRRSRRAEIIHALRRLLGGQIRLP